MNQNNIPENEISLLDIIKFLQESWKAIAGFTLLGIVVAVLYLWVVPKQYEANAQIKMAQIPNGNNINPMSINIEEPQALIARMALPTSYPKETVALCGLADQKDPEVALASKVKLSILKGVSGTVDLKVRDASKEIAKACTDAVFQLIKTSQGQLIAPYINEASKKLKIEEERLGRAINLIARADKSGVTVSAVYLATRDEIRYLLDQIASLQNIITGSESRAAHLAAPIYLKKESVFPQKRISLMVGLLLGSFLGLALAVVRKWCRSKWRSL